MINTRDELKKLIKEYKGEYNVYFVGADTQAISVDKYVADSIRELFNQLLDKGKINGERLDEFYVIEQEKDIYELVMSDDEMYDFLLDQSDYYYSSIEIIDKSINSVVTTTESTEYINLAERTIRENCEKGKYNARKVGGIWLIDKKSLFITDEEKFDEMVKILNKYPIFKIFTEYAYDCGEIPASIQDAREMLKAPEYSVDRYNRVFAGEKYIADILKINIEL